MKVDAELKALEQERTIRQNEANEKYKADLAAGHHANRAAPQGLMDQTLLVGKAAQKGQLEISDLAEKSALQQRLGGWPRPRRSSSPISPRKRTAQAPRRAPWITTRWRARCSTKASSSAPGRAGWVSAAKVAAHSELRTRPRRSAHRAAGGGDQVDAAPGGRKHPGPGRQGLRYRCQGRQRHRSDADPRSN